MIDVVDAMRERGARRVVVEYGGMRVEVDGLAVELEAPTPRRRAPTTPDRAAEQRQAEIERVLFAPEMALEE